ncbi:MAG TPA: TlpA disulfide reductase family protein [Pirellulales bacterium]|nr:TlpA disulfide reductase family protein [Pirellulales bacterium]
MQDRRHVSLAIAAVALVSLTLGGRAVLAEEPAAKGFIVFPVTTDLQKALLNSHVQGFLELDVAEFVPKKKFEPERLDQSGVGDELTALAWKSKDRKPDLYVCYRYANIEVADGERQKLEAAVNKLCRECGFAKTPTSQTYTGETLAQSLAKFPDLPDDPDATEPASEDERVRVYPVRTRLSRLLLTGAETDCFVLLRQPIDGRFRQLSPATRDALRERVGQFELPQKRQVTFDCMTTTPGQRVAEKYFVQAGGGPDTVTPLVEELGFQKVGWRTTHMSVSPEDLLGKPAPDFTLPALAGGEIHLQEALRGRVGLIAFWGVACGSCCVEARYLTKLHDQYADQGLAVIGVNGYEESKEVVEKFVAEAVIKHPIAMMGGVVARVDYTVASYPITYFVNRSGTIVDYHLGFEAGDEKHLAETVTGLLGEAKDSAAAK